MKPAETAWARALRLQAKVIDAKTRFGGRAAFGMVISVVSGKLGHIFLQARNLPVGRSVRADLRARPGPVGQRIGIVVTGGIGDYLVIARFLRDLGAACGGIEFDVFSYDPPRTDWILGGVPGFGRSYPARAFDHLRSEYDVALRLLQTVEVSGRHVSTARVSGTRLGCVVERILSLAPEIGQFGRENYIMDNFLARYAVYRGCSRRDFMHWIAGVEYGGDTIEVASDDGGRQRSGIAGKAYVTVHNGFDTNVRTCGRPATKCYPRFGEVVAMLRRDFPGVTFVQIGESATSVEITECDVSLLGRTSLKEAAGVLRGALMHLDNESGLVHLARCFGVPSTVVFGPTPADFFGYPGNGEVRPTVCGDCWWLTRNWMRNCAMGYEKPLCMTEQHPSAVAQVAAEILRKVLLAR